jgi:hypothetical protein
MKPNEAISNKQLCFVVFFDGGSIRFAELELLCAHMIAFDGGEISRIGARESAAE